MAGLGAQGLQLHQELPSEEASETLGEARGLIKGGRGLGWCPRAEASGTALGVLQRFSRQQELSSLLCFSASTWPH